MTTGPVGYFTSLYHRFFPERQIYHRCNHQVHFTTISGRAQVIAVATSLVLFGWIAYASVNVIFTTQIMARMETKLREAKRRWEGSLADVLIDYERLQAGVAVVREQLDTSLSDIEERQRQVDTAIEHKSSMLKRRAEDMQRAAELIFSPPEPGEHTSVTVLSVEHIDPTPRVSRRGEPEPLFTQTDSSAEILDRVSTNTDQILPSLKNEVEVVRALETRLTSVHTTQYRDLIDLEENVADEIGRLEGAMALTEMAYEPLVDRFETALRETAAETGQGGPFVGVSAGSLDPDEIERQVFLRKTVRIQNQLSHLAALRETLNALPITRPVAAYRITSAFGVRPDPWTGRMSRHFGLDIAGARGTPVVATAKGKVKQAGKNGGYGLMVKIDHGNRLVTIYAHLDKVIAKRNQTVDRGDVIGFLGSTGRSTAPHLHYEIKYNGKPVDPRNFFEAGRYVFENQG